MSSVIYIAHVTGEEATGYQASFPDLPGVTTASPSTPQLLRAARELLLQELKRRETEGLDWPSASTMDQLRSGPSGATGLLLLIDVQVDDAPVRVNISIGERLLKRIDEAAEAQNMTRSGFVAAAARQRLGDEPGRKPADEASSQKLYDEILAMGRRVNEALGPESAIVRAISELDSRAFESLRSMMQRRPRKE